MPRLQNQRGDNSARDEAGGAVLKLPGQWTLKLKVNHLFLKEMAFSNRNILNIFKNFFICLRNEDLTKGWASSEYSEVFDARLE